MRSLGARLSVLLLSLLVLIGLGSPLHASPLEVEGAPAVTLRGVPFSLTVKNTSPQPVEVVWDSDFLQRRDDSRTPLGIAGGESQKLTFVCDGEAFSVWKLELSVSGQPDQSQSLSARNLPGWVSILPPLIAIGLALATRQVLVALLVGIFSGAFLVTGSPFGGFTSTLDTYLINSIADRDHAFILLFTMTLGGMVALISASGGMQGLVEKMSRWATTPATTQIATWAMGMAIFFDDYANTLLVGQTMRPATDKQKISREKLAYLVDSTSAPIASIALISTWIGYEMSLIAESFAQLGIERNVYSVFVYSILHRYYAIFTIFFVLAVAYFHRDFGPMLRAERRAASGIVDRDEAPTLDQQEEATWGRSAGDAIWPVLTVLMGTIAGLVFTGWNELGAYPTEGSEIQKLGTLISSGNSFRALLWASVAGGLLSAVISKVRYKVSLEKISDVYLKGVHHMAMACVVLVLAWAIGDVCETLSTGPYLVELFRGLLSPHLLPTITFLLSAAVAFATGTSWGTMAIVLPLAVRLAYELPQAAGMESGLVETILVATIAGVLAGATFGDHCSPISDTTIMSSMASGCHHIDHVRTQMPYAVCVAVVAILLGTWPAAYGWNAWLLNIGGIVICVALVRFLGQPVLAAPIHEDEVES